MSVHASKWAWGQQCSNPTSKLVLMALADHANAEGECYPTMKRVAELAGVAQRTVHDRIKDLEAAGLVERVERRTSRGEFRGWVFRLAMHNEAVGSPPPPAADRHPQSAANGGEQPMPVAAHRRSGTVSEPSVPPLPPQGGSRANGTNPRALDTQRRKTQQRQKQLAYQVGTPEYEQRVAAEREARERLAGS